MIWMLIIMGFAVLLQVYDDDDMDDDSGGANGGHNDDDDDDDHIKLAENNRNINVV